MRSLSNWAWMFPDPMRGDAECEWSAMATQTADPSAADARPGPTPAGGVAVPRGLDPLKALSALPALFAAAWLLTAFPALLLGVFHPLPVTLVALVLAALFTRWALPLLRRTGDPAPWWTVAAVVAIAAACAAFTLITHSSQLLIQRDAGSYAQIGYWLAHHPNLPIDVRPGAFNGDDSLFSYDSAAFYINGDTLIPQFMSGWPLFLAAGYQAGGWTGLFGLAGVVGGCAVLATAGLTARLAGARWAPLAALLTASAWPLLHVFQGPYSEPLALLLLVGGLGLLIAAIGPAAAAHRPGTARRAALPAGLVIGVSQLVRLDSGVEAALLLPVVGWWWAARRPGALAFLGGLVLGFGLGVVDMAFVTRPYVQGNWSSVKLMGAALALSAAATIPAARFARQFGWAERAPRWFRYAAPVATALVLLAAVALFVRPYVQIDRSITDGGVIEHTALVQRALGLPVDGTRSYAEQSPRWLAWYVGWPLLALAVTGALILTWRVLRGRERAWLPVLPVLLGSTLLTLVRPGITPDHPWADRRLVVVALPCVIMLAVWALAQAAHSASRFPLRRVAVLPAGRAVAGLGAVLCLVPTLLGTFPIALHRTEQSEPAAVAQLCAQLDPDDSVVSLDVYSAWLPVVRGECGLPAAYITDASPDNVQHVINTVRSAGRAPVLIASTEEQLTAAGLIAAQVADIRTDQDNQVLVRRPTSVVPVTFTLWLARP